MPDTIQFNKQRDFGEVFNASFTFIKQEFKGLFLKIFLYTAPMAIVTGLVTVYFQREFMNFRNFQPGAVDFSKFFMLYFLIMIAQLLNTSVIFTSIFTYFKLYISGNGQIDSREFNRLFFNKIGFNILYFVLIGIMCGIGFVFCLVPGIYLFIVLSLVFPILYFENHDIGDAISRSFKLSKNNWWLNFGVIMVSYIIVFAFTFILSIPSTAINLTVTMHTLKQTEIPAALSIAQKILTVLISVISSLLYVIPCAVLSFQYFSCKEKNEMTNVMDKIDTIGNE